MSDPVILPVGPYPDRDAVLTPHGPHVRAIATRGESVTLAASVDTRHILGPEVTGIVGPEGMIITIARASNIDKDALFTALCDGRPGSAAPDPRFPNRPDVVLQPHHASGTYETRQAMGQLLRDTLTAHFAGQPLLTAIM